MLVSTAISSCQRLRELFLVIPYHKQAFTDAAELISDLKLDSLQWITLEINEYPDLLRPAQADWERLDTVLQGIILSLPHCDFDICSRVVEKGEAVVLRDWYRFAPPKEPWRDNIQRFLPEIIGKGSPKIRLRLHGNINWEPYERLN